VPAEPGVDIAARRVDGLELLATRYLQPVPDAPAATLVVRVEPSAEPSAGVDARVAGIPLGSTALERLRCDAAIAFERTRADGGVQRTHTTQTIPRAIRRAVLKRDRHMCRWPSCTNTGHLHLHHIVWRSQHGAHTVENLVALCPYHHRAVHDRGWRVAGTPDGDLQFVSPNGRVADNAIDLDILAELQHLAELYADQIDQHTIATATGERLDIHWAVGGICDAEHLHRRKHAHSRGSAHHDQPGNDDP